MKKIIGYLFLMLTMTQQVAAQSDDFCTDSTSEVCKHYKNFLEGDAPDFPEGEYFTVGNMVFDSDTVEQNHFMIVMVKRKKNKIVLTALPVRPSNDDEREETNQYIENLAIGKRDESSGIHKFINQLFDKQEFFDSEKKDQALVYQDPSGFANGIVYVRQKDGFLYLFTLKTKPKFPGSFDRVPGYLFAFFPYAYK